MAPAGCTEMPFKVKTQAHSSNGARSLENLSDKTNDFFTCLPRYPGVSTTRTWENSELRVNGSTETCNSTLFSRIHKRITKG